MTRIEQYQVSRDKIRKHLLKYTRKAFHILPRIERPRILDIGCGSGIPTLELARLSQGVLVGIDVDQPALDRCIRKIQALGLCERVKIINCSMLNMYFLDRSFDIVWAEGSIAVIGFENGLRDWRRLLKDRGFLVVHDNLGNLTEKMNQVSYCGYELLNHFILDENIWRNEYYAPLDKEIEKLREKHIDNSEVLEEMKNDQHEIDELKREPGRYRSVFFIMRKRWNGGN